MHYHHLSDLKKLGFRPAEIFRFLKEHGLDIRDSSEELEPVEEPMTESTFPEWKQVLSLEPYLYDCEAASAFADIDPHQDYSPPDLYPGPWRADVHLEKIKPWLFVIRRAIEGKDLKAEKHEMLIGMNVVEVADEDFCPKWKIRHADLAAWCAGKGHPYPLPPLPNEASPLTTDAGLRETLASREEELEQSKSKAGKLQAEIARLHGELNSKNGEIEKLNADAPPSERSEKTYLNIIGGLVALMLGKSGVGKKPSVFRTQEVIIGKLLDDYESIKGISKSNLDTIMAKANNTLKESLPKEQSAGNDNERIRP